MPRNGLPLLPLPPLGAGEAEALRELLLGQAQPEADRLHVDRFGDMDAEAGTVRGAVPIADRVLLWTPLPARGEGVPWVWAWIVRRLMTSRVGI